MNVNVAPGSRSVGLFTRLCEAPATSLHPTNEPGPQLGRHIPCFRQAVISQAAKTYVVLEHSCGWSFPAITPFGWEAPVSIHLGRGFFMHATSWLRRADAVARCTPSSRGVSKTCWASRWGAGGDYSARRIVLGGLRAYLPFKGDWSRQGSGPIGMARHSPSAFQFC